MNSGEKQYWFPAKRYGWGWGFPACWQGWVVFITWLAFLIAGNFLIKSHPHLFIAYVALLTIVLVIICLIKGEPPRWRWGR